MTPMAPATMGPTASRREAVLDKLDFILGEQRDRLASLSGRLVQMRTRLTGEDLGDAPKALNSAGGRLGSVMQYADEIKSYIGALEDHMTFLEGIG